MKIITFNLRNFTDDHWEERFPFIVSEIKRYDADILSFQEIRGWHDPSRGPDMADQLHAELKKQGLDYPHLLKQRAMDYKEVWEGLGIMSKVEPRDPGFFKLDPGQGDDPNLRIMLHAVYDLPVGPVRLINTHIAYEPAQATHNIKQVIANAGSFKEPCLLMGDFNMPEDEDVYKELTHAYWIDLWLLTHPGEPCLTYGLEEVFERRDYMWKNNSVIKIKSMEKIFTERDPATGLRPSDHFGLMITL